MIQKNSVEWSVLIDNLCDAKEHLESLTKDMLNCPEFFEKDFEIQLGHIYAHLNRAWNSRNMAEGVSFEKWDFIRQFPNDIKPVG